MTGQINFEDSKLGACIVDLVQRDDVSTIVEIGTWNGLGTTRCVLHGLRQSNKKNFMFISLECNKNMYNEALLNNKDNISENVCLKLGRIVDVNKLDTWFDINALSSEQATWLAQDKIWLNEVPYVLDEIPDAIDLLILDGGEFSTYLEWHILKDRVKYVALDDTGALKCAKIRQEIIDGNDFEILEDDPSGSRYGMMVAKVKEK